MNRNKKLITTGSVLVAIAAAIFAWPSILGPDPEVTDSAPSPLSPLETETSGASSPPVEGAVTPSAAEAAEQLERITTAEPLAIDYDVSDFGPRWHDLDKNGCDQRNDTLARDLVDVTFKPGTNDCIVLTGTLHDRFTGETVPFERVSEGYQPVQIDHLVPRKKAAEHGALALSERERLEFANDPLNLQSTSANQTKGDKGPSEWMPIDEYACDYAIRYVAVSTKYSLSLSPRDHKALETTLSTCTALPSPAS